MRIVSWDDAIERLSYLTLSGMIGMIRHAGDVFWMQEAAKGAGFSTIGLGAWKLPTETGPWPVVVLAFTREASPVLPKRTGAAVFQATPGRGDIEVQCFESFSLDALDFAGDPNGEPSTINGDVPYFFAPAEPEAIAASLGLSVAPTRS